MENLDIWYLYVQPTTERQVDNDWEIKQQSEDGKEADRDSNLRGNETEAPAEQKIASSISACVWDNNK